jgi:anti-sigma factor RsiW
MTCDMWQIKLEPYVDSELSGDELTNLESHLRACPSCAADALGRLQMKRMTQAAGARYSPTPQFRLRIEQSIKAKRKPFGMLGWMPIRVGGMGGGRRFAGVSLAAAAAVVVLMVGSVGLWVRHSQREQALTELADLHVATLASTNPVDVVSTDQHTVKPWFAGKLPFSFDLPELQGSPFKLVGGRVTYFEHSPGAQLLFEVRKHQLSVFIVQDQAGTIPLNTGSTKSRQLAFNIETWAESGLRYVVISDATPADVHDLGELFRRAARS